MTKPAVHTCATCSTNTAESWWTVTSAEGQYHLCSQRCLFELAVVQDALDGIAWAEEAQ